MRQKHDPITATSPLKPPHLMFSIYHNMMQISVQNIHLHMEVEISVTSKRKLNTHQSVKLYLRWYFIGPKCWYSYYDMLHIFNCSMKNLWNLNKSYSVQSNNQNMLYCSKQKQHYALQNPAVIKQDKNERRT